MTKRKGRPGKRKTERPVESVLERTRITMVPKSFNTSQALSAHHRRSFIAEALLVLGLTQTEIVEHLAEAGFVNPKTGQPWSLGTVNRDVHIMREQWQQNAIASYGEHVENQLARIRNAQKIAYERGDLDAYARFIEQEMKLLGTAQNDRTNVHADPSDAGWEVYGVLDSIRQRLEDRQKLLGDGPVVDGVVA